MKILIVLISVLLVIFVLLLVSNHPLFFREKVKDWSGKLEDESFAPEAEAFSIDKGRDKAILFIHGFPASPSVYYIPGDFADKAGFDVYTPRLPGFGTKPEDLLDMNFSTWYAYLKEYYLDLRGKYKQVHIVGTSMGGSLALKLGQEFNEGKDMPTSLVTIAAPVFLNSIYPYGRVQEAGLYIIRPMSWFIKSIKTSIRYKTNEDQDGYENWTGYNGLFLRQTYSLYMNLKKIRKGLKKINSPVYLIHARTDATVPYQNLLEIQKRLNAPQVRAESIDITSLQRRHHCLFLYTTLQEALFNSILGFIRDIEDNYLARPKN